MAGLTKILLFILLPLMLLSCSANRKNAAFSNAKTIIASNNSMLSEKLGVVVPNTANLKLVEEIVMWQGTPYKFGGTSLAGIDCSGFICKVYPAVYQIQPPRTTLEMHKNATPVASHHIQEGDIVFFNIGSSKPSHAGIYLWDGYFAHASTSKGVMVSNLSEAYWKKYFTEAGRFLPLKL